LKIQVFVDVIPWQLIYPSIWCNICRKNGG